MKVASISEAKNNLSALIAGLAGGASVLIVDRGRPVARLEGIGAEPGQADQRLARLVREGVVRPARGRIAPDILGEPPPKAKAGSSALQVLLNERREGR